MNVLINLTRLVIRVKAVLLLVHLLRVSILILEAILLVQVRLAHTPSLAGGDTLLVLHTLITILLLLQLLAILLYLLLLLLLQLYLLHLLLLLKLSESILIKVLALIEVGG